MSVDNKLEQLSSKDYLGFSKPDKRDFDPGNESEESIQEVAYAVEQKGSSIIHKGQDRISQINELINLDPHEIEVVARESNFFGRIEDLQKKIKELIHQTKEKILNPISEEPVGSPISPGEIFNPEEELKNIRQVSAKERRQGLEDFKEKFVYQKAGLARIQEQLINIIRANPDTPPQDLFERVEELGAKFGMDIKQRELAKSLIWEYSEKHAKIAKIRSEYPDDKQLYCVMFGSAPHGEVEVIEGPVSLYFRCGDLRDYTVIHSQKFLKNENTDEHDKVVAEMSGGVSIGTSLIPGLEGAIIAENSISLKDAIWPDKSSESIYKHEEQHAIKRLFGDKINKRSFLMQLANAQTDQQRETVLKRYLRVTRQNLAEEGARDEILAYFKDGRLSLNDIFNELTASKDQGGLYDYLSGTKEGIDSLFNKDEVFEGKYRSIVSDISEKVFGFEYRQLLKESIDGIEKLKKIGLSREEIIAILIHEPLARWRKVIQRLCGENTNNTTLKSQH